MTALHLIWAAFVWLPAWARVLLCAFGWMGFAEILALLCSAGTRFDVEVARNEHHRAMEALAQPNVRPLPTRPFRTGTAR